MNETTHRAPRAPRRRWSWNDPATRALIYQVVILGLVALVGFAVFIAWELPTTKATRAMVVEV